MSSRRISLVFLILLLGTLVGLYWFFFVGNQSHLAITLSTPKTATVEVSGRFGNSESQICNESCTFEGLPPTEHTITLSASGYITKTDTVAFSRGSAIKRTYTLELTPYLEDADAAKQAKLAALKERFENKAASGATGATKTTTGSNSNTGNTTTGSTTPAKTDTQDLEEASITRLSVATDPLRIVQAPNTILYTLPNDAKVTNVIVNDADGLVAFRVNNLPQIYDVEEKRSIPLVRFTGTILGIKRAPNPTDWIIASDSGALVYSRATHEVTTHPLFDDAAFLKNNRVVGLVRKDDTKRQSLMSASGSMATVFLQDLTTRERRVLFSTDHDIVSIQVEGDELVLLEREGKRFRLRQANLGGPLSE